MGGSTCEKQKSRPTASPTNQPPRVTDGSWPVRASGKLAWQKSFRPTAVEGFGFSLLDTPNGSYLTTHKERKKEEKQKHGPCSSCLKHARSGTSV